MFLQMLILMCLVNESDQTWTIEGRVLSKSITCINTTSAGGLLVPVKTSNVTFRCKHTSTNGGSGFVLWFGFRCFFRKPRFPGSDSCSDVDKSAMGLINWYAFVVRSS